MHFTGNVSSKIPDIIPVINHVFVQAEQAAPSAKRIESNQDLRPVLQQLLQCGYEEGVDDSQHFIAGENASEMFVDSLQQRRARGGKT